MVGVHVAISVVILALLPHGFTITDLHTWANTVVPAVGIVSAMAVAARRMRGVATKAWLGTYVAATAGVWLVGAGAAACLFPVSVPVERAVIPIVVGGLLAVLAVRLIPLATTIAAFVVGGVVGVVVVAQRGPVPSTQPLGGAVAVPRVGAPVERVSNPTEVRIACGSHVVTVHPVLTFESRSPDRTWTLFAPRDAFGAHRTERWFEVTSGGFRGGFADDGESSLVVTARVDGAIELEAVSHIAAPLFAHLDSFTTLDFDFDRTIAFSALGATRFDIEPADYPTGRPMKLAFLGDDRRLHIVRARSAEKGPFIELATGALDRGDSLSIELRPLGEGDAGCRFTFLDWSAQVSTEVSPTAGWGVPQNSIQFAKHRSGSSVVLTLADTGPGRGFDSVGHVAGTYRNRALIAPLR